MKYENQQEMNAALISVGGVVLVVVFSLINEIVLNDEFRWVSFFLLSLTFIYSGIYAIKTGYLVPLRSHSISHVKGKFAKQLGVLSIIVGFILFFQMFSLN